MTSLTRVHITLSFSEQAARHKWFNCMFSGGLTAVMWTDFIQTCIMVVGAVGLMIIGDVVKLVCYAFIQLKSGPMLVILVT